MSNPKLNKLSRIELLKISQENNIPLENIKKTKTEILKHLNNNYKSLEKNKKVILDPLDIKRIDQIITISELSKESRDNLLGYCQAKKWTITNRTKTALIALIKKKNKINYHEAIKRKNQAREELVNLTITKSSSFNPIPEIMAVIGCEEIEAKKLYDNEIGKSIERIKEEINRKINLEIDPKIREEIQKGMIICVQCNKKNYGKSSIEKWLDKSYCLECHNQLFSEIIQKRWEEFQEWKKNQKLDKCMMECGSLGQHFDHKNIFDKCCDFDAETRGLANMVNRGYSMDLIYKEIKEKTIPLCVSCHNIVTKLENKYFLTRLKSRITKECKQEEKDDMVRQELVLEHKEEYDELCQSFYQFTKETINHFD